MNEQNTLACPACGFEVTSGRSFVCRRCGTDWTAGAKIHELPNILFNKALKARNSGNLHDAENALQSLLAWWPEDGQARLMLADILEDQGHLDRALVVLKHAPAATSHREQINELADDLKGVLEEKPPVDEPPQEPPQESEKPQLLKRVTSAGIMILFGILIGGLGIWLIPPQVQEPLSPTEVVESSSTVEVKPLQTESIEAAPVATAPLDLEVIERFRRQLKEDGFEGLQIHEEMEYLRLTGEVDIPGTLYEITKIALRIDPNLNVDLKGLEVCYPRGYYYMTRAGDSLSILSLRLLGDHNQWTEIYEANRERIRDPDKIEVGEMIVIPR